MPTDLSDDPRLTAFGLLAETSNALFVQIGRQVEPFGLSPSEFEVLIRLSRSPGNRLRMADLATQAMLSASGLTRLIDRLESAALVQREACPNDRRGSYAALTPAGEARLKTILPGHLDLIDQYLTGVLTEGELVQLSGLLRKIRDLVRPGATAGVPGSTCADEAMLLAADADA